MNSDHEIYPLDCSKETYENLPVDEKKRVINEVIAYLDDFLLNGDLTLGGHSDEEGTAHLATSTINYHKSLLGKLE